MLKEKFKTFISNPFAMTFSILGLMLFSVMLFMLLKSNDANKISNIIENINKINNQIVETDEFSSKDFIESFNQNILDLESLNKNITELKVSSDHEKEKQLLLDIVSKNTDFYKDIIYLLENINGTSTLENNKAVLDSKTALEASFSTMNELNHKLGFINNTDCLLNKFSNYVNELIKLSRDSDINTIKESSFKSSIDLLYIKFAPLNEDMFFILNLVKEDGRSLNPVLDSINQKIEDFAVLNDELYSLSVPSGYEGYFTALQSVFKQYDIYIKTMREYLIHEINKTSNNTLEDEAKKSYEELNKQIVNFQKLSTEYK